MADNDDNSLNLAKQFAWEMVSSMTAPLPYERLVPGIAQFDVKSVIPASLALPANVIAETARAVEKLEDGEVEAAASDMGKTILWTLPANQLIRQGWQVLETMGAVEE